jgi:hypothetical protein
MFPSETAQMGVPLISSQPENPENPPLRREVSAQVALFFPEFLAL